MSQEVWNIIGALAPAVAVYAAIRADMADLKARMKRAEQDIQHLFKAGV